MLEKIMETLIIFEISLFIFLNSLWIALYRVFRKRKSFDSKKLPPISIIIPAYNKEKIIGRTIEKVLKAKYPRKEVIVVNDGSTDKTLEICKKYEKEGKIRVINQEHKGKAEALNLGIKNSSYDIIVTIDADSLPKEDALINLVKKFYDEKVGAVAGNVKSLNKKSILNLFQNLEYLFMNFQRFCQSFLNAILICPGPLSAYKKEVLEKANFFESNTLVEDFDMTLKIQKLGYKVVYAKDAVVETLTPSSLRDLAKQRIRWGRGGIQIARKHSDLILNKNSRMLGIFSFPLHILWLFVPILLLLTFIFYSLPNSLINLINYFKGIEFEIKPGIFNVLIFYILIEDFIISFFSLNNLKPSIALGYLSVLIFLFLTFQVLKSFNMKFKPSVLKVLIAITIYWLILLFIFVYAAFLEILGRKREW